MAQESYHRRLDSGGLIQTKKYCGKKLKVSARKVSSPQDFRGGRDTFTACFNFLTNGSFILSEQNRISKLMHL
jgi:hypothetical protein